MTSTGAREAPARTIGIVGIILIAANGMIGTGIFALPGTLQAAVGSFAPLLLLFAGLGMACIALSFGDCARHFDRSGGPLLYVGHAFGPLTGFVVGWLAYVARIASIAANATVLATTLTLFFPWAGEPLGRSVLIILLFATLIMLNIIGVRRALAAIGAITVLKVLPLLVVSFWALAAFGTGPAPTLPHLSAVEGVALVAIYAFTAFETATVPASEARDPRRIIPIALVGTVLVITALYALVQWAYDAAQLPPSETPLVDLATLVGGPVLAGVMAATIILSIFGNQASAILANSRLTVGMADERMIPPIFATLSPRFGTPLWSILLYGLSAMALALSGTFVFLAVVSALARLFAYLGCIAAAPRLDRLFGTRRGWLRRVVLPVIGALLCLWAMTQTTTKEWQLVGLLALAGAGLYFLARRERV
ncbi:APC family permease [Sphingomonas jaspsi]|uniref:APC family permease n=1 Tax=Sphingomonas jaspsi TaxID=392409 RepID=UPI0004BA6645|nr:APC family permease [Sphingomonas jaspsi]